MSRILIAEDSPTQAELLRFILEEHGYTVEVAPDGLQALALLEGALYDLVISDIQMPGLNGYELCHRLKADPARRHVPVILLTSLSDPMDIVQGLECGADNFLTKPCGAEQLLARIKTILDNRQQRAGKFKVGAEVVFLGKRLTINSDKEQILDLLISTFEDVVRTNRASRAREAELAEAKRQVDDYARRLEGQVRFTEGRYQRLLAQAQDGVLVLDSSGNVLEANRRATEMLGQPSECLHGRPLLSFVVLAERPRLGLLFQALLTDGSVRADNLLLARPDGRRLFIDLSVSLLEDGGERVALALAHDVSERKRVHQRLQAQHATTQILAESASLEEAAPKLLQALCESLEWQVGEAWRLDQPAGVLRFVELWHSPTASVERFEETARSLSLARGQGLPGTIWDVGEAVWVPDFSQHQQFPRARQATECGLHAAVGFPVWLGQEVLGVFAFFNDRIEEPDPQSLALLASLGAQVGQFSERKRAEEGLRLRERAIAAFFQGVVITDASHPDNPILFINQGFEKLTGYTSAEVLGRNCKFLQGPKTDPAAVAEIHEALREQRPCLVEILNYRKDGSTFWNALSIAPLQEEGRLTHFVAVQTDVTPLRLLEEQLRQSQKMEAVGQLAGGVAHDFNNLLTVINGFSELMLASLPPGDRNRSRLQAIHEAGQRAAGLTRQLLAFSRKEVVEPKILDLNALVLNMEKLLRRLIGEDVRLATALGPNLARVCADPGQIEQVLMNLAVNARDAMPQGGRLTLETANVALDEAYTRSHAGVRPGRYVLLAVTDSGCGISKEVRARIFEPFFTTKGTGKGTGLGLSVVHGIVKQAGGHVEVYSELERGSTFKVYLPAVDSTETTPQLQPQTLPRGDEVILLVEDEAAVRATAVYALETLGYTVLEVSGGEEALRLAVEHVGPIHLLVTDMVMPGMNGRQVAERLQALRPGIRVLYLSGYSDTVVRHGVLQGEVAFLQKPFTLIGLAQKVRDVLR